MALHEFSPLNMVQVIQRGAEAAVAADPRPLQSACTVTETFRPYSGRLGDDGKTHVRIEGPTREAVEQAQADYRATNAACDPRPAFFYIQNRDGKFVVTGSRGNDPRL